MAKKRKSDTRLDEVDRSMYNSFCTAANSLSQLYTHSMNQQQFSFHAGQRHALEKLYDWILRRQEGGSRVNTLDIVTYLQNELEYGLEETPMPPRSPFQSQQSQTTMYSTDIGVPGHPDHQAKNSVFSNALSSPVRWSLQQHPLSQGDFFSSNVMSSGNGARNSEISYGHNQIRDPNTHSVNDLSMDMHADSPDRESSY
ncbi:Myb-like protein [Actinidia chinensis var. chinensis]|uniref:Myb-like protein n=1 Tax=Actinidia chinensis var. chinensis TaxID=1590841 RepID=A0A2R6S375_ACTCC|nr:Myb-like protein [Actinidia chinensis var. chinensis]